MLKITTICLVRHGETDWNVAGILQGKQDTPLNENGKKQAKACGDYLKAFDWDIMVTSPLRRAKQTAEIIQKQIRTSMIEMPMFMERGFGEAEGLLPEERDEKFPNKIYPGQEELEVFSNEVLSGIEKISQMYSGKRVLVVTHGAAINIILAKFSNNEIGTCKTTLINACLNNIEYNQECWKIKDFNQVEHLATIYNS